MQLTSEDQQHFRTYQPDPGKPADLAVRLTTSEAHKLQWFDIYDIEHLCQEKCDAAPFVTVERYDLRGTWAAPTAKIRQVRFADASGLSKIAKAATLAAQIMANFDTWVHWAQN